MKKLFVLMVLVVAMVAAPLFAEITEDGWAGDFTYKMGGDFSSLSDSTDNDMDLSMSASVGEFTTFSVGIEADPFAVQEDSKAGLLVFNSVEMTQDFGAMFDLGVDLTMKVGNFDFGPTEYESMFDFEFTHPSGDDSIQLAVGTAGVTATVWAPPVDVADSLDVFAAKAVYESDMANVAVNYVRFGEAGSYSYDFDEDGTDDVTVPYTDNSGTVSASTKVMPTEDVNVYASVEANLDTKMNMFGFGADYTIDALTVKAAFEAFVWDNSDYAIDVAVDDTGIIGLGVDYAVNDTVTAKLGAFYALSEYAGYAVDAAVCVDVDTVEYKLGVSYAPVHEKDGLETRVDSTYAAAYSATDFAEDFAVSLQMDVDF